MKPETSEHDGILVVRDDLFPGGTKARFLPALMADIDEAVYAGPAEGGAQTAIATVARSLGRRATLFIAHRAEPHPRSLMAKRLGAAVMQVRPGYLNVVRDRARQYCATHGGAALLPFGLDVPLAVDAIAAAGRSLGISPDEVWCASGSGVLARGLAAAWPRSARHVVEVGRSLAPSDVAGATIHPAGMAFGRRSPGGVPFPSDPHYDAKAWHICKARRSRAGLVVFWNVTGPAEP